MKKILFLVGFVALGFSVEAADITVDANGKHYLLHDDGTWEYAPETNVAQASAIVLQRKPNQTQTLTSTNTKYRVSYDPQLWTPSKPASGAAEFGFDNKDKNGFGMVIYDGLELSLEMMEKAVITNAARVDPNAKLGNKQPCVVNGTAGELLTYTVVGSGVFFTFLTFVATTPKGSLQVTFYTTTTAFNKLKPSFVEAISGLEF